MPYSLVVEVVPQLHTQPSQVYQLKQESECNLIFTRQYSLPNYRTLNFKENLFSYY